MPTSEGRIYRDTSASPTKGISLDDIGNCIGLGARDLGTLCQGMKGYEDHTTASQSSPLYKDIPEYRGLINNWSKAKPVWFTGANSLLPPKTTDSAELAHKWEVRYRGNLNGASGRINTNIGTSTHPAFSTVYANEVPMGDKLYGTSTDSGSFLNSHGGVDLNADATEEQVEHAMEVGGWMADLMMDGNKFNLTSVYALRWRYNPPLSGVGSPFFQLDYDGYDHNSQSPMPIADSYPIKVNFEYNSFNDVSRITIPIRAIMPSNSQNGGITFDELNAAIRARRIVDSRNELPSVSNPTGNPFQKGYCEKVSGAYVESTDFSAISTKTYYKAKDLSDLYLSALLYHRCGNSSIEDGVTIDYTLWLSSSVKMSEANNSGWDLITMDLHAGAQGTNPTIPNLSLDNLKDALLGNDGGDVEKEWRIKMFWSSVSIGQNSSVSGAVTLVRGNDDDPAGTLVTFKDAEYSSASPYVTIYPHLNVTSYESGGVTYYSYSFTFNIVNALAVSIAFTQNPKIQVYAYTTDDYSDPDPQIQTSSYNDLSAGRTFSVPVGLGDVVFDGAPYKGFLVYVKYTNKSNNVTDICGAWIPVGGDEVYFSPGDPDGHTWAWMQEEYDFTLP